MPIKTTKVMSLNLWSIKKAIEELSRSGFKLNNPSKGGNLYSSTLPAVTEWEDGTGQFTKDGANMKLVYKIDGKRYTITLTQE